MPSLNVQNFALGLVRDAAVNEDGAFAAYDIQNYDLKYAGRRASLRRRAGSRRYNATAYAAAPDRIFHFIDSSQNEHILLIYDGKLYRQNVDGTAGGTEVLKSDGSTSLSFTGTLSDVPFVNSDNRVWFADDNDWYWADDTSLDASPPICYQAGIDKLDTEFAFATITGVREETQNSSTHLNDTNVQEMEQSFQIATTGVYNGQNVVHFAEAIQLQLQRAGSPEGFIRVRVEGDTAGDPSGTLADNDAYSEWHDIQELGAMAWVKLNLQDVISYNTGATYHIRIQTDQAYKDSYAVGVDYVAVGIDTGAGYANGAAQTYNGSAWSAFASDISFIVGGDLTATDTYRYKFAASNESYKPESITTDLHPRKTGSDNLRCYNFSFPADTQVDRIAVYRTDAITATSDETFRFLGWLPKAHPNDDNPTTMFVDAVADDYLGDLDYGIITDDHFRLRDSDATEVAPALLEFWKQRMWAVVAGEDSLFMSKILDAQSALGDVGWPALEAFPTGNRYLPKTSGKPQRLIKLDDDRMALYFDNEIAVIAGCNIPRNPPPDLAFQMIEYDRGLAAPNAVATVGPGMQAYLSRQGLLVFSGQRTAKPESLSSGFVDSILADISDDNLAKSILRERDGQLWLAVDEDDDGTLDTFLILDMNAPRVAWRKHVYNFGINDFIIMDAGAYMNRVLVATDMSDKYLRQVETLTGDVNASGTVINIDSYWETQDIYDELPATGRAAKDRPRFKNAIIQAYYPAQVPSYTTTIVKNDGVEVRVNSQFAPTGSGDVRGHRRGLPRVATEQARVRIQSSGQQLDELRELTIGWDRPRTF